MGVDDADDHPWLVAERDLLAGAVRAGLAVLGVCLGAQQLARALGAEVRRGDAGDEVGPGEVELTSEGLADPVLGPAGSPLPCVHWHGDTFSLPVAAAHLAASGRYAHQAFRVGRRCLRPAVPRRGGRGPGGRLGGRTPPRGHPRRPGGGPGRGRREPGARPAGGPGPVERPVPRRVSWPTAAARSARCRRAGSTRPPWACRSGPGP